MKTNKLILYQTFPRLFGNFNATLVKNGSMEDNGCGKFNSYTVRALEAIRDLGVTHIWYTGVIAHASCTDYTEYGIPKDHSAIVKGKAGSPYAVKDYYDVDPDLAEDIPRRMDEFEALVQRTHAAGMKAIIDFVPNHVSRNYHSIMKPPFVDDLGQHDDTNVTFSDANNFYYLPGQHLELHFGAQEEPFEYSEFPVKATGNDCFNTTPDRNDWYETIKLNYGIDYLNGGVKHFDPIPDTWIKMLEILQFWMEKDIDGFRCDMAEMVPVEFWTWVIPRVKSRKNVLFIGEIYRPDAYRDYLYTGHFDYLYDKVGMYDTLRAIICGKMPTTTISACWRSIDDIKDRMLFFLENHDEQRIASDFFADRAQSGIPGLTYIATSGSNPVLIYNGQELGEKGMDEEGFSGLDGRTTIFDYWSMDSVRRWANNGLFDGALLHDDERALRDLYQKILRIAREENAITSGAFYGLAYCNQDNLRFPCKRMMAYLRAYENELILVCINFDRQELSFRLTIPQHAFDLLLIPDNTACVVKELISGEESVCALTYACDFQGVLPGFSAKLFKFSY
jgi:glycosidase